MPEGSKIGEQWRGGADPGFRDTVCGGGWVIMIVVGWLLEKH